jgi:hypothetical protein
LSLILTGLVVAGGVIAGRLLASSLMKRGPRPPEEEKKKPEEEGDKAMSKKREPEAEDALAGFPCQLGDVVIRHTGEEAWLAGAVLLSEQAAVAALFVSPDAGSDRFVYVRAQPSVEITWLAPLAPGEIPIGAEPPSAIEHGSVRFERARRLPLRARRLGTGAPDFAEQVLVGEYGGMGADRLLVVLSPGKTRVFRGTLLESGTYDVLPGGKQTLIDP